MIITHKQTSNYTLWTINPKYQSLKFRKFGYIGIQLLTVASFKKCMDNQMMIPSKHLHLRGFFTSYLICYILVWCWTNPEGVAKVQAGGGVRSTEPLLKAWCEQQPRRGGRMATSYTSYRCSATPSGLLISYHRQAGVTLRSTTCLWSSQPFGLHFTTSCHTR